MFFDFDNDTQLDLAFANGHIMDNAPQFRAGVDPRAAQPPVPERRLGGSSRSLAPPGPGFALEKVSRGLVSGDIDNDGDLDLLVTNNGQTADLLRNDGGNRQQRAARPTAIGKTAATATASARSSA